MGKLFNKSQMNTEVMSMYHTLCNNIPYERNLIINGNSYKYHLYPEGYFEGVNVPSLLLVSENSEHNNKIMFSSNNCESTDDVELVDSAYKNIQMLAFLTSNNPCSIVMPILPSCIDIKKGDVNKADSKMPYYQQLSKECFDIPKHTVDNSSKYYRIDNQMVNLIEGMKVKVSVETGKQCEDKIVMFGYSSAGAFAQRMYALHPEIMDTLLVGGASSEIPVIEDKVVDSHGYPLIIDKDVYKEMSGKDDFDIENYKSVKQIYFISEQEYDAKTGSRRTEKGEKAPMHDMTYMDRSIHSGIGKMYRDRFDADHIGPEKRIHESVKYLQTKGFDIYDNIVIKGCNHHNMIGIKFSRNEVVNLYDKIMNKDYFGLNKSYDVESNVISKILREIEAMDADIKLNNLMTKINNGDLKVNYDSWSFSGGRDWGNWDSYSLLDDKDTLIAYMNVDVDHNNIECWPTNGFEDENFKFMLECMEESEHCKICDILEKALKRDDKIFVDKISDENGVMHLPCDYGDISRKDILNDIYVFDKDVMHHVVNESKNNKVIDKSIKEVMVKANAIKDNDFEKKGLGE